MSVPDCVPNFARLANINTQLTTQCHWHNKPRGDRVGQRCGNSISKDDGERRRVLVLTLHSLVASDTTVTNTSYKSARSSGPLQVQKILQELSQLLLCKRQHRVESAAIYAKWSIESELKDMLSKPGNYDVGKDQRSNGLRPSAAEQPSIAYEPSTPFPRRTSTQNSETPESSASNVWSRTSSVTISTPVTSPPSQQQFDTTGTPHDSPHLRRRATTINNADNVEPQRVDHNRLTRSAARQSGLETSPPKPAPSYFKPYYPPNKSNTFLRDLHGKITSPLTTESKKSGYIYGFQRKGEKYIKIGYTQKTVASRVQAWERSCHQKLAVVFGEPVLHASKVESLIHLTLYHERRTEIGCNGGKGCKTTTHKEWFEVTLERVKHVLGTWKRWIETEPYDKKGNLRPIWIKHIEQARKTKTNCSLESWRDWIDITILAKGTTRDVKPQPVDDAKVKTKIVATKTEFKDETEVNLATRTEELRQELNRLNRSFVASIVKLKDEIPEEKPIMAYPTAVPDLKLHLDDPFVASAAPTISPVAG
jgi:hypothetical protein